MCEFFSLLEQITTAEGVNPRTCLVTIWSYPFSQFAILRKYHWGLYGMRGLLWTDFPRYRYFAGGGREGHCEHVGALVPVINNASTRAMVIDSMG
jgi:hypothetical protein